MAELEPNPYQSPREAGQVVGIPGRDLEDLRTIAIAQKCLTVSIFSFFPVIILGSAVQNGVMMGPWPAVATFYLGFGLLIMGCVSGMVLGTKIDGLVKGIFVGFMGVIPCLGLIPLVMVHQKATNVLEDNGFYVSFTGASLAEINARIRKER